jgi:hypothetical protein
MICETEQPMSMRKIIYNLIAILAIAAIPADASAAPKVGVAAAVQNDVQGILGGSTRTLASGSDVFTNERIRTGQEAMAQILLLDKTSLTVGPRSELTLDRFVYNPSSGAGQVVVNAVRGAFRFVSGSQPSRNYTIRTPIGYLGVRGSVGDLLVQNQQVIVILVEGGLAMNFKGRLYVLDVPGTAWVFSPTAPPRLVTWDGTLFNAGAGASLPLYGWRYSNEPFNNQLPANNLHSIDNLNAIIQQSRVPPPIFID